MNRSSTGHSLASFDESMLEEKTPNVLAENERILVSESAFEEFIAAISGEPEKPSEKVLAAVALYKNHPPVARRS